MLKRIFTWWNGATLGALFDIGRRGAFVGEDEYGNRYYEEKKPSLEGRKRRYVIYRNLAEASLVTPDWHGWMHHIVDEPPTVAPMKRQCVGTPAFAEPDRHRARLSAERFARARRR